MATCTEHEHEEGNEPEDTFDEKQNDELLIEMVRRYPCLYDKTAKDYKNARMREEAWRGIADVLNMTGRTKDNCFSIMVVRSNGN